MPQVLGWVYFNLLLSNSPDLAPATWWIDVVMVFFLALVSISVFGYLFNDLCDVEGDKIAGKPNALGGFHPLRRIAFVATALAAGIFAWINIGVKEPFKKWADILFALQILTLIAYSLEPIRLKNRAETGVIADASYGHLNPVLITFAVFYDQPILKWATAFFICLILVCSLKGIRNILLHQIEDRKQDRKANINTAVIKYGPVAALNFINRVLLPIEFVLLLGLTALISYRFPPFAIAMILFLGFTYLVISGWKLSDIPKRQLRFKFLYVLNDFYEGWMPVFFLLLIALQWHQYAFLLILHLILFPSFVIKLWHGLKKINENFKTAEDY